MVFSLPLALSPKGEGSSAVFTHLAFPGSLNPESRPRKVLHFRLDPMLHLIVQITRLHTRGVDRPTNAHGDSAGVFEKRIAPPKLAAIMRDWNYLGAGVRS